MTATTATLTDFLLARIADDEAFGSVAHVDPITRDYAARVLAECAAKGAIVAEHSPVDPCNAHDASFETIPCDTVRHLAAVYADHEDFQEEWRA